MSAPTCGLCGNEMTICDVTPCLDCGGNPRELDHWETHTYTQFGIIDGESLCDFCAWDMASSDPAFWGFPDDMDWDAALAASFSELDHVPSLQRAYSCPNCWNSLRRQEFIVRNARRNNVELPRKYWAHL